MTKKRMTLPWTRPFWCFDKKCKIIFSRFTQKGYDEGASSFCYGALPEEHSFTYRKVEHKNNMCHCYYTPLKGAIRFFCNEDDIWSEIMGMLAVLNQRIKTKCRQCGRKMYRILRYICDHCAAIKG